MFKKLRNKFLTLNMIMISILLVSAFCVVFMMTYNNINIGRMFFTCSSEICCENYRSEAESEGTC